MKTNLTLVSLVSRVVLVVSIATVGCTSGSLFPDAGPIYVAVFSELAVAADHYTIQVE